MEILFEVKPGQIKGQQAFDPIHGNAEISFQVNVDGLWLDGELEVLEYWSDKNCAYQLMFDGKRIGNAHALTIGESAGVAVAKNSQSIDLHLQIKVTVG